MSCNDCLSVGPFALCCDTITLGELTPLTAYTIEVTDASTLRKYYFATPTDAQGNFALELANREQVFAPNRTYEVRAYTALCALDDAQEFTVGADTGTCLSFEFARLQDVG